MTNAEYESACLTQAKVYDKFEGEHKLRQYDEMIDAMEKRLEVIREQRREIINRYNLNKCDHEWVHSLVLGYNGYQICTLCGEKK